MAGDRMLNIILRAKDEASSQIKNIAGAVGESFGKISNYAGIAAGAIEGFAIKGVKDLADLGEHLDNLADTTGSSIGALSALQTAGDEMGVSIDTIGGAMNKMNINLAGFSSNSKTAKDALGPLGLSLKDLKGLSADEQFMKLGNAITKIEDPAKRAAAGMKIFGKSQAELQPLFDAGNASMDDMVAHAKELGVYMDQKTVAAARNADMAFDQLGTTFKGVSQQLIVALAPAVTDMVNTLQPLLASVIQWIEKNPQLIVQIVTVTTTILGLLFIVPKVVAGIQAVGAAMAFLAANPIGFLIIAVAAVVAAVLYFWNTNEGFRAAITGIWNAIKLALSMAWDAIKNNMGIFIGAIIVIWEKWGEIFEFVKGVWNNIITFLGEKIDAIKAAIDTGMSAAASSWKGFWDSIYSTVSGIVSKIISIVGGVITAVQNAVSAVSNLGGAAGSLRSSGGGLAASIKGGKAIGGPVLSNSTYLVGEKGPELLTMGSSSGNITPNNALGGGGITINITGNTLLDSQAALKMGDLIMSRLRLQQKLA